MTSLQIYFDFNLSLNTVIAGIVSPNKKPQGFNDSTWSQITFIIAVSGIDKNIPGRPHKAPPQSTTITETKALIFTLEATTFGEI